MEVKIFIWLLSCLQWKLTFYLTVSISGGIKEKVSFVLDKFPVPPSMRTIIEVDVYYPNMYFIDGENFVILGIYTTSDHINFKKQCTYIRYGQLRNNYLHPGITMDPHESEPLTCHETTW